MPPLVAPVDLRPRAQPRPLPLHQTGTRFRVSTPWLLLIGLGVALRLAAGLQPLSLWHDEACLALNLRERSPLELLRPLDHDQAAPVGFLFAVKACITIFGESEFTLRLVPALGSAVGVLLFAGLARRLLSRRAALIALGLFTVGPHLTAAAVELKQYATDATVALALTWLALPLLRGELPGGRLAALAGAGAVAVWCSFPALFVLGGLWLAFVLDRIGSPRVAELPRYLLAASVWFGSFAAYYLLCLRGVEANNYLREFWADQFLPLNPVPAFGWLMRHLFMPLENPAGLGSAELPVAGLGLVALAAGCFVFYQRERAVLLALLAPLGLALVASALQRYPFCSRFLLFAAPALLLLVGCGAERLCYQPGLPTPKLARVIVGLFFLAPVIGTINHFRERSHAEELRPLLAQLDGQVQPGDQFYVYYGAKPAFAYYGQRFAADATFGGKHRGQRAGYRDELSALPAGRIWAVFSHRHGDEERWCRDCLDARGPCRASLRVPGAAAYLYEVDILPKP